MTWTQEQIDEAAKRAYVAYNGASWEVVSEGRQEFWRNVVLAAQMPIAEIDGEEWNDAAKSLRAQDGIVIHHGLATANELIARRNAPPKPDLREKIAKRQYEAFDVGGPLTWEEVTPGVRNHWLRHADRILAIVKEGQ